MRDNASFERQALGYLNDVFRFAMTLTHHHRADAEDLVQETFLRAYRAWHTFRPGTDARRWLFTICRNAFLKIRRRTRHWWTQEPISLESIAELVSGTDGDEGEERLLTRMDLSAALGDALDRLAEPYRSVVMLVDVEHQEYETASVILGVPIGTVRSRLFRGRRLLRAALAPHARDWGLAA